MSTLIELAVQRLEQLRGAGVAVPTAAPDRAKPRRPEGKRPDSGAGAAVHADVSRRVTLNANAMSAARILSPSAGSSQLATQFRLMKRPLLKNIGALRESGHAHPNLIMVTSALAGEGKSFTATNLAMSMAAELDHRVLLIDADVARPSLPRTLGFDADKGLLDVLEGRAELSEVLLRTDVDKLSVLPSGAPRARATELLASEAMRQLLDEMSARYPDRVIIFDSPPLLLTSEASVLAIYMGQLVVVVQAERTSQTDVQRALSQVASHPLRLLVLNQVHSAMMKASGYGYGYDYAS